MSLPLQPQRLIMKEFRVLVEAQAAIRLSHGAHESRLDLGLALEVLLNTLGACVQDLPCGGTVRDGLTWLGHLEKPNQEV